VRICRQYDGVGLEIGGHIYCCANKRAVVRVGSGNLDSQRRCILDLSAARLSWTEADLTGRVRRNHSPAFKAKVALTAINGEKTLADIGEQFDVHPNQITPWRKPLLEGDFARGGADIREIRARLGLGQAMGDAHLAREGVRQALQSLGRAVAGQQRADLFDEVEVVGDGA
jgi:transposase-like protein